MPKLPEIRYSTNVQSLGREDVGAPGRLAAARIGAAQSISEGVKEVERSFAAAEYTKQMSQARNSINELYDTVVSKEAYTSSEIPEFVTGIDRYETVTQPDGTEVVQERIIPASEVREAWFKQGMQNITNGILKGTKTPTARARISNELKTSIGPAAYNQLLQYNRAAVKKEQLAILDASVQDAVINGDRLAAEETLYRFLVSGLISKDDYETRKLEASQDLDIEAYSQEITDAEDTGDLEDLWDRMNSGVSPTKAGTEPSDMTPEQRRGLRAHINSQRIIFDREERENILETERNGTVLLNNGELTTKWVNDQLTAGNIERPAAMALMNSMNASTGASGSVKRDTVIAAYQEQILNNLIAPEFGVQISDLSADWKKQINGDQFLNGLEKEELYKYVADFENNVANNPQYKQAVRYIRNITGVPEGDIPVVVYQELGTIRLQKEIFNGLLTGLVNYMDEFGAEAEPLDWVVKNKENYMALDPDKPNEVYSLSKRLKKNFPELAVPDDNIDADAVMADGFKLYYQPGVALSEQKIFDLWQILYDTSVDLSMWEDLR